jgi:2-succinyl-5-enolpyruvyl-6-hydroxy-3-cyclohexene-1-carboxylate synthase
VSGRPTAGQPEGQSGGREDRPGVQGASGVQGTPALTVFERTFGTPHGVSFEHLAAAFGIPYSLAERPGEIAKAVAATVPGGGPRIVEARTGRAPNADLRARMHAAALAALTSTI